MNRVHRALHPMSLHSVPRAAPSVRAAEREHAGVLPGTVVVELARRASVGTTFELVFTCRRLREQRTHRRELVCVGKVRRRCDRKVAVIRIVARTCERDCLQRLRRRTHEADETRVAGLRDHGTVLHRDGMDAVARLDDSGATDDYG